MDSNQDESGNDDKENLAEEVVESLGEPKEATDEVNESKAPIGNDLSGDPLYVQKRLKQQKRAHEREIRELHARMAELQSNQQQQTNFQDLSQQGSPNAGGEPGIDNAIQKAVSFALQHREMEERKAKEAQSAAHIARQYQDLQKHLDHTADKYEDFDDTVRGEAPFTPSMRDAALLLPKKGAGSAGEVLYRLGKNPEELNRIANLHPVDQASELIALSHALIGGGESKSQSPRSLGQVKSNPVVNSAGVTEKTPPSAIRALMKAGKFK